MAVVVGIDVGATGGVAFLEPGAVRAIVMPSIWDFAREMELLDPKGAHVFIERAQSFPKQGVASSFNYGRHFGELLGVIVALGLTHTLVPPAVWARVIHAGTKGTDPKARSLEAVRRLFPGVDLIATPRSKIPHLGIVDALAIAEYGRRQSFAKETA